MLAQVAVYDKADTHNEGETENRGSTRFSPNDEVPTRNWIEYKEDDDEKKKARRLGLPLPLAIDACRICEKVQR